MEAKPRPTRKGLHHHDSRWTANRLIMNASIATRKATRLRSVHGKVRGQKLPARKRKVGLVRRKTMDRGPSGQGRRSANLGQVAGQCVWGPSQQCPRKSLPKLRGARLMGPRPRNTVTLLWKGVLSLLWDRCMQSSCASTKTYTTRPVYATEPDACARLYIRRKTEEISCNGARDKKSFQFTVVSVPVVFRLVNFYHQHH